MDKNFKMQHIYSNIALLTTALILGLSFVAQKWGMDYVEPFTFNTLRNFLGALSLLPIIFVAKLYNSKKDKRTPQEKDIQHKTMAKGGIICGIFLFLALSVNQYCMKFAPAGKAGFITSLYIIFVPIISVFFLKYKLRFNVKISIVMAVIGLYFLCFKQGTRLALSDIFLAVSAFIFALHLLAINHFTHKVNFMKLSCIQFLTAGVLSLILMLIFEHASGTAILAGLKPILFSGVVVTGVAYTLQIFGQKHTQPVIASLILSMESVFAVLGGMLILGETLSYRETLGCVIMISAIIFSQIRFSPTAMKRLKRMKQKRF